MCRDIAPIFHLFYRFLFGGCVCWCMNPRVFFGATCVVRSKGIMCGSGGPRKSNPIETRRSQKPTPTTDLNHAYFEHPNPHPLPLALCLKANLLAKQH